MKNLIILIATGSLTLATVDCRSIDKTKLGDKEVITVTEMRPVILTLWGATTRDCLRSLDEEGATDVTSNRQGIILVAADGRAAFADVGTNGLFSSSRLSSTEVCQATGTK